MFMLVHNKEVQSADSGASQSYKYNVALSHNSVLLPNNCLTFTYM